MQKRFSKEELVLIKRLNTPHKLQQFLDTLHYNKGRRVSAADVLRKRKADCLEAAAFASLVLSFHGIENFLIDLSAPKDEDHVLCIYKEKGLYGAVAQSKFLNLRHRLPVYKSLRELAISYFHHYFDNYGKHTLRKHSIPLRLDRKDNAWVFSVKAMYRLERKLDEIKHIRIVDSKARFPPVSREKFLREMIIRPSGRFAKRYL